jgi:AAA domain
VSDCDAAQTPPDEDLFARWADFDDPDLAELRDGAASAAQHIGDGMTSRAGIVAHSMKLARAKGLDHVYGREVVQAAIAAGLAAGESGRPDATAGDWRAQGMTATSLRRKTFAPVQFVLPALIPEGIAVLAGKPRVGKSSLALDLCLAVAAGGCALGSLRPAEGDVLYLALEDSRRRLQRRVERLLPPGAPWPQRLTLVTRWLRLEHGGLTDLAAWGGSAAAPRLIVIDTLTKVLQPAKPGRADAMDGKTMAALHRLAAARGIAVIAVQHTRSKEVDGVLDSMGLHDAADTILVLARTAAGAVLHARGRDIEDSETALQRDKPAGRWTLLGPAADVRRSLERRQILDILAAAGGALAVKDIMRAAGIGRGRYALPNLSGEGGKIAPIDGQTPDHKAQNGNLSNLSAVFATRAAIEGA